jgi:hypothetical protein
MGIASYQEDDFERYVDALRREIRVIPRRPVYTCDVCGAVFSSDKARTAHVSVEHPVPIPLLLLGRVAAPRHIRIRNRKTAEKIGFSNCRNFLVECDGSKPISYTKSKLKNELETRDRGHYRISLEASGEPYVVSLQIVDGSILRVIDQKFVEFLAVDAPRVEGIGRFVEVCGADSQANDYIGALADYVMGTIIKDQDRGRGATVEFGRYKEKYESSRAVLFDYLQQEQHKPPVPEAICNSIDLSLNQFEARILPAGVRLLDDCIRFFIHLAGGGTGLPQFALISFRRGGSPKGSPICPLDGGTHQVLRLFERLSGGEKAPLAVSSEVLELARVGTFSEYDRAKLYAFAAVGFLSAGQKESADEALRHLVNDSTFRWWAGGQLYSS